jgi:hypothetical protein
VGGGGGGGREIQIERPTEKRETGDIESDSHTKPLFSISTPSLISFVQLSFQPLIGRY